MNETKKLIDYKIKKSKEAFDDAQLLFLHERFSSSVNRIYYSLFYIVTALLLTKELSSSKHVGVKVLFNKHFVKTNMVDKEYGKFFSNMFSFRQKGDYADFINFEKDSVKE